MEEDKTQQYLNGLVDVCAGINNILAGNYIEMNTINPEPLTTVMKRHTDHVRIMETHMVGTDLTTYSNIATMGEQWIINNQQEN